jgi:hypothetical protein
MRGCVDKSLPARSAQKLKVWGRGVIIAEGRVCISKKNFELKSPLVATCPPPKPYTHTSCRSVSFGQNDGMSINPRIHPSTHLKIKLHCSRLESDAKFGSIAPKLPYKRREERMVSHALVLYTLAQFNFALDLSLISLGRCRLLTSSLFLSNDLVNLLIREVQAFHLLP